MSVAEATEPTAVTDEVTTTAEVPEAPDTPASPAPVAETAPADPSGESSRPRDPKTGRFIKADGSLASDAEQAAIEASIASPEAPAPASPPPAPATAGTPFVVRGDGQRFQFPDATLTEAGDLMVKASQVPNLRMLISEGLAHKGSWRQKEQEYKQQIEQAGATERAQAEKYNKAAVRLWNALSNPEFLAAASRDPREIEYLRREVELELRQADMEAPRPAMQEPQGSEPDPQALQESARATLKGYVEELLERPQAKTVYDTPEKRQALEKRLQRRLAAYFTELEDGSVALHENAVDADFEEELNDRLAARQEAEKARKAAEFNAKRNAPPPNVPPVVSTKAPPPPAPASTKYESRDDWRRKNGIG